MNTLAINLDLCNAQVLAQNARRNGFKATAVDRIEGLRLLESIP
jgi:hypothetical protein